MCKWPIPKVDNSDLNRIVGLDHDVLGFQIRMDNVETVESRYSFKHLFGYLFYDRNREVVRVGSKRCQ